MGSPLTIDFIVETANGFRVRGLRASEVSFLVAKLVPGDGTTPFTRWASYLVQVEQPGVGPGTECRYQATTENGTAGDFTDHGDGSYTYVTAVDITDVTPPPCVDDTVDVAYRGGLRHRVSLEVRGPDLPILNPICDFVPNELTGDPEANCNNPDQLADEASREIVDYQTCNGCHGALSFHGGPRITTSECVLCHNPGSADANSGNTVDFKVMIHKIHRGSQLPSVQAGGSYQIWGYNDRLHDYSDVDFPHPDSDKADHFPTCTACHDTSPSGPPDASNYQDVPSIEACGSCHEDTTWGNDPGAIPAHQGVDNGQCSGCHDAPNVFPQLRPEVVHEDLLQEASDNFVFDLQSVSFPGNTAAAAAPTVTFRILDGKGNPRVLESDLELLASNLSFLLAFDTDDYFNYDLNPNDPPTRRVPAQPDRTSVFSGGALNPAVGGVNGGPYTLTLTEVPQDGTDGITIEGVGTALLQGHPQVEITDPVSGDTNTFNARAKSTGIDFYLDGSNADVDDGDKRREKVTLESCNGCHRNLTAHGSNRNDSVLACLTCHNPNATDIGNRPTLDDPTAVTPDGKIEESINFAWMIHSIHAEIRVFADLDASTDIRYPQSPGNCLACHTSDGFFPVLGLDRLGTTIITASTLGDGMGGAGTGVIDDNPLNDVKMTPNAAACGACHVDESDPNDLAKLHFEQNGGSLNACQLDDGTLVRNALDPTDPDWANGCQPDTGVVYLETCIVCHDPGSVLGADVVHPLIE